MKKILPVVLALVLCMTAFAACDEGEDWTISLDNGQLEMVLGTQTSLNATVKGTEESITWASSDETIVKVSKYGQLQALKIGTATITASIGSVEAECVVTVVAKLIPDVTDVKLLCPGEGIDEALTYKKVTFEAVPELQEGEVLTYSSADANVAVIEEVVTDEEKGTKETRIVAKGVGTTVVTATAPNGTKADINVVVEALNENPVTTLTFEITTAAEVPEYCGVFLAGTLTAWGPMDGAELQRGEDNKTFKGTFEFDFSKIEGGNAARAAEYKYIMVSKLVEGETVTYGKDTGWEQYNGSNTDNRKMFVNNDETITAENVVFQSVPADPRAADVENTVNITLKLANPVYHDIYLVGPFSDWNKDETCKFEKVNDKEYKLTKVLVSKAVDVEMKINDGTWDWDYGCTEGTWVKGGSNYKLPLVGEVVDGKRTITCEWNISNAEETAPAEVDITNTINVKVVFTNAEDHDIYFIGGVNDWKLADENMKMAASEDHRTFTLTTEYVSKGNSVEVKINNGTWDWDYGCTDGTWVKGGKNYSLPLEGEVTDNARTIELEINIDNAQ